jgi:hypothetical protein
MFVLSFKTKKLSFELTQKKQIQSKADSIKN